MALTFTKKQVQRIADVLMADHASVGDAAVAALDAAYAVVMERAKYTVVGQVKAEDNKGAKVALGWYATEKQATDDALKLAYSSVTHEEAKAWVMPIHNGSPAAWYGERKDAAKQAADSEKSYRARELQRRIDWVAANPGEPMPLEWTVDIPHLAQTDDCTQCHGTGRVPKPSLEVRADMTYRKH